MQKIIVSVKSSDTPIHVDIPVWRAEVPMNCTISQIMVTNEVGYSIMPVDVPVTDGNIYHTLKAHEAIVFRKNC